MRQSLSSPLQRRTMLRESGATGRRLLSGGLGRAARLLFIDRLFVYERGYRANRAMMTSFSRASQPAAEILKALVYRQA